MTRILLAALTIFCFAQESLEAKEPSRLLPSDFVYLRDIDPTIQQEMRYSGSDNFIGRPIAGYNANECILRRDTARALEKAQGQVRSHGYSFKVYDCYRPRKAVLDFKEWSRRGGEDSMRRKYYPDLPKNRLFGMGYISSNSVHSKGDAVDLTLVPLGSHVPAKNVTERLIPCDQPKRLRAPDNSLDFGTGFDCFSQLSHTKSEQIGAAAKKNREFLVRTLERVGFRNYRREWWHFEYQRQDRKGPFDFDVDPRSPSRADVTAGVPKLIKRGRVSEGRRGACDLMKKELVTFDENGRNISVKVFASIKPLSRLVPKQGRDDLIVRFSQFGVVSCGECTDVGLCGDVIVRMCKLTYVRSASQDFSGVWVVESGLREKANDSPERCSR